MQTRSGRIFHIDEGDVSLIAGYTWFISNRGYVVASPRTGNTHETVLMHRLILGVMDKKVQVDHINGDRSDNRRSNLRTCIHAQNMKNSKLRADNASGFKGVCYNKRNRKWVAQIQANGIKKHLGLFENPEVAHEFYCLAADMLHGEFANYGHKRN